MPEKYLIGDVSHILKLSKDTLRYYDKLGIVSPKKDPHNNYRYYTIDDLLALSYVLTFRDLEVPLEDIKVLMQHNTLDDFAKLLAKQQDYITQKLLHLQKLSSRVSDFQEAICLTHSLLGKFEHAHNPPLIYHEIPKEWDSTYAEHFLMLDQYRNVSYPVFSILISAEALLNTPKCPHYISGISSVVCDPVQLDALSHYRYISPNLCVHTVIQVSDAFEDTDFSPLRQYFKDNQLQIKGDLIARNITFEHHHQSPVDYYELWIPINIS
ncbi:MAG: MerR family transcriptional regulator [Cellulosilyticaceae bacterium]